MLCPTELDRKPRYVACCFLIHLIAGTYNIQGIDFIGQSQMVQYSAGGMHIGKSTLKTAEHPQKPRKSL